MVVEDFIKGARVIAAWNEEPVGELSIQAEHDQIWIGGSLEHRPTSEQQKLVEEYGFFFDDCADCWSAYV